MSKDVQVYVIRTDEPDVTIELIKASRRLLLAAKTAQKELLNGNVGYFTEERWKAIADLQGAIDSAVLGELK